MDPETHSHPSSAVMTSAGLSGDVETTDTQGEAKSPERVSQQVTVSWLVTIACIAALIASLYVFLVGLQLLGDSFKCLGGRGAGSMFAAIENPIAGLMTGVLATVLVQSSSTSTSIVVGLVGADQFSVRTGIPVIMGANIGTSVTNTIVALGHVGDRFELQRAFAGATVHDMFNYLTVITLLPIEIVVGAIQGEGGPLYWLTKAITDSIMGNEAAGELFPSPIKSITSPVSKLIISNNKYIISALAFGAPTAQIPNATNSSACTSVRRLRATPSDRQPAAEEYEPFDFQAGRALLSRRLTSSGLRDCSHYYCVSEQLDKAFKKISSSGHRTLTQCEGHILEPARPCRNGEKCFLDAGAHYLEYVQGNAIIKGGFTKGAGDVGGGIISLVFALVLLCGGLFCLTRLLHKLCMGKARGVLAKATRMNDYLALLIGIGITILVQSSSVTTSALTPFCGMGMLTLEKMFLMTLGANIGTTVTALIAALTLMTHSAVQIAMCHLFFNIIGISIWFPVPYMRRFPLSAARLLGLYASFYRIVPLIYILVAFVAVPGLALAVSAVFSVSVVGGVIFLSCLLVAFAAFEFWWLVKGGCYRVISKADRQKGQEEIRKAQEEILGEEEDSQAIPVVTE